MLKQYLIISFIVTGFILAGCGGTTGAITKIDLDQRLSDLGFSSKVQVNKISGYELDGWQYVDEQHLIINSAPGKHYLVGLHDICYELQFAEKIRFSTTTGQVIAGDSVIASRIPDITRECWINGLYELVEKDKF